MSERGSKTPTPNVPQAGTQSKYQQYLDETDDGRQNTHYDGCWKVHHRCAIAEAARLAAISADSRQIREDARRVLVPREPTKEMVKVGEEAWCRHNHGYPYEREIHDIWRTMYDAAIAAQGEKKVEE